jgi:Ser/Thr protein kinase RdoA (MazF antagonist)
MCKVRACQGDAPVPLPAGETILEHGGHVYALFPCAQGNQLARARLTLREATAIGYFLAQLHQALRYYPHDQVSHRSLAVDSATTFAKIEALEQAIRSQPQPEEADAQVLSPTNGRSCNLPYPTPDSLLS